MKNLTKTQKLTISALCMALYLVVMMCTQSFGWFGTFGYVRRRFGWYYDKSDNSLC